MNERPAKPEIRANRLHIAALVMILAAAFFVRTQGIQWPKLHPDENPIGNWVVDGETQWLYPSGFFVVASPVYHACNFVASRVGYFLGDVDNVRSVALDRILFVRWVNVVLGTATCLLIFLFVRGVSGSGGAGLFAAALLAFSQYPIEHGHYAETDVPMVFTLCLFLWLWSRWVNSDSILRYGIAAFAGGFAAGTKFTLVVLLAAILADALFGRGRGGWLRRTALVLLGLLLFAGAFVLANQQVLHWKKFVAGFLAVKSIMEAEMASVMGPYVHDRGVRYLAHAREFVEFSKSLGAGWLVLCAGSLPFLFRRPASRFWPVLVLVPLFYTYYWIVQSPWVRSQEFMNYLPFMAATAALLPVAAWGMGRPALKVAVGVVMAAALAGAALSGLRTLSVFAWKDTRVIIGEWLAQREPDNRRFAEGPLAVVTVRSPFVWSGSMASDGIDSLLSRNVDYLIQIAGLSGRGVVHPVTGEPYPESKSRYDDFLRRSELLCDWSLFPPKRTRPSFVSPDFALYGLRTSPEKGRLDAFLPQVMFVSDAGRETYFPLGRRLGSSTGIAVDLTPSRIAVGGGAADQPVYLVLTTAERPADIVIRGYGRRVKAHLDPFDAAVVTLQRSPWVPRLGHWEVIEASAEPVENMVVIPCYLRVAFDPLEAAGVLLDGGRADRAVELMHEASARAPSDPIALYRLAVELGDGRLAEAARPKAEAAVSQALAWLDGRETNITIGGVSALYCDEFAQLRIPRDISLVLREPASYGSDYGPPWAAKLMLPAYMPAGRCEVSFDLAVKNVDPEHTEPADVSLCWEGTSRRLVGVPEADDPSGSVAVSFPVEAGRERPLYFEVLSAKQVELLFSNITIRWNLRSRLETMVNAFLLACARDDLQSGRLDEAGKSLKQLCVPLTSAEEHEVKRLKQSLAREKAGRDVEEPEGRLRKPVVFEPFVALTGFILDPAAGSATCQLEALRDDVPALALAVFVREGGRWKRKDAVQLAHPWDYSKGDRWSVTIPLAAMPEGQSRSRNVALAVESYVQWHRGQLPVRGRSDGFAALADILE